MAQSTVSTELLLEQITAVRNSSNVLPARQDDEGEVPKAVRWITAKPERKLKSTQLAGSYPAHTLFDTALHPLADTE